MSLSFHFCQIMFRTIIFLLCTRLARKSIFESLWTFTWVICENQFKGQIIITSEETINDCSMRGENLQRKKTHEGNLMGCNITSLVNKLFIPIQYLFKTDHLEFTQFWMPYLLSTNQVHSPKLFHSLSSSPPPSPPSSTPSRTSPSMLRTWNRFDSCRIV